MLNQKNKLLLLWFGFFVCLLTIVWLMWQNFSLKLTVDYLAQEAGAGQAMSEFRHGQLIFWESVSTNDFPRFSGHSDGVFSVWYDEYHSDEPSAWHYGQKKYNEAHNAQMKLMYQHPDKFKFNSESASENEGLTNILQR
jgi:hypothetical protein